MSESSRSFATLLTPAGSGAIAVVRIHGTRVADFLSGHFTKKLEPLRCVHGELRDGESVIDDPVVVLHRSEQTADLNLHGGPWVVASTIELLRQSGFEIVDSLPDCRDALEREVVEAIPLARTEAGLRLLLAQVELWRVFVETRPSRDGIQTVLFDRTLDRLLHPAKVAIVGAPNVGKSTLANQLFAQERSITADVPGTTRDWVGELANLDGVPVMLVDTPGVRETDDPIEREAIERSRQVVAKADLVVQVLDATDPQDHPALKGALIVLNKVDRRTPTLRHDVATVATTGVGIDRLRSAIRERLGVGELGSAKPQAWTERHRAILREALNDPSLLKRI